MNKIKKSIFMIKPKAESQIVSAGKNFPKRNIVAKNTGRRLKVFR